MGKYDEVSVVRQLSKVGSIIGIDIVDKVIKIAKNGILGNGTNGKIDFLTHYCGYHIIVIDIIQQQKERDEEIAAKKAAKKAARKAARKVAIYNKNKDENTIEGISRAVSKRMRAIKRK